MESETLYMSHIARISHRSSTKDARLVRTRAAYHAAMLSSIAEKRFEDVTIREISQKAGTFYQTFFRHYENKEALLKEAAEGELRRLHEVGMSAWQKKDQKPACVKICNYVSDHRLIWRALLSGSAHTTIKDEFVRIASSVSRTEAMGWTPGEVGVRVAVSSMLEILSWWLRDLDAATPDEVAELVYRLAIQPGTSLP
jgi:AcrR family transcriptional regulator